MTSSSFYRGGPDRMRGTNLNMLNAHISQVSNVQGKRRKPFDPKEYVGVGLGEREVMIYKEIFDLFDTSNNQMLAPKELLQGLKLSGLNVDMETTYNVVSSCNLKDISKINFKEFLKLATDARPCDKDQESEYYRFGKKIFKCFICLIYVFKLMEDINSLFLYEGKVFFLVLILILLPPLLYFLYYVNC